MTHVSFADDRRILLFDSKSCFESRCEYMCDFLRVDVVKDQNHEAQSENRTHYSVVREASLLTITSGRGA